MLNATVSRSSRHPLLLAGLALLAILPTVDGAHQPHPTTGNSRTTVATAASHAEQSPHFEASEIVPLAPCTICLLQRSARQIGGSPALTALRPAPDRPPVLEPHVLARQASVRGARAPPFS